jgi:hypothetical protein
MVPPHRQPRREQGEAHTLLAAHMSGLEMVAACSRVATSIYDG